jgi:hypothetical protein
MQAMALLPAMPFQLGGLPRWILRKWAFAPNRARQAPAPECYYVIYFQVLTVKIMLKPERYFPGNGVAFVLCGRICRGSVQGKKLSARIFSVRLVAVFLQTGE